MCLALIVQELCSVSEIVSYTQSILEVKGNIFQPIGMIYTDQICVVKVGRTEKLKDSGCKPKLKES